MKTFNKLEKIFKKILNVYKVLNSNYKNNN